MESILLFLAPIALYTIQARIYDGDLARRCLPIHLTLYLQLYAVAGKCIGLGIETPSCTLPSTRSNLVIVAEHHLRGCTLVAIAIREVVGADEQENLGWLTLRHGAQTVEYALGCIATDTAVLGVRIAQQLCPLATVGDAIAEEDDVALAGRQRLKQSGTLIIECGVFLLLSLRCLPA